MDIRVLSSTDAAGYRELRLRALREHPEAFTSSYEEETTKSIDASRTRLSGKSDNTFWGAFLHDVLVGMVGLDREQRVKNRHKATLIGMYVAPEAGRSGAGRALVGALLAQAQATGVELLLLTVTQGNEAARELYLRCGFQTFGIEPDAVRVAGRSYAKEHMYLKFN
jgi:ribosomal protein S18 acetylase RimI-like enzyme